MSVGDLSGILTNVDAQQQVPASHYLVSSLPSGQPTLFEGEANEMISSKRDERRARSEHMTSHEFTPFSPCVGYGGIEW